MTSRTTPMDGPRAWAGTGLLVIALLSGVWTLGALVADGPWTAVSALVVLVLAGVTGSVRRSTRSRTAPSAWGLTVAVLVLGALYGGRGTGPSLPLPTPETFERLTRLARSGVEAIADGRIPVEPVRGLELLVVAGAAAAFLAADLIALGLGRAGMSGLVLVALWTPAVAFERNPPVPVLLVGGLAFLLLLSVTRPLPGHGGRAFSLDAGPAVATAAVVTALAVVAGPVTTALPFFGAVRLPSTWGPAGLDGPLRLSTDLDMRSSLAPRSDRPVLTYTTTTPDVGPLRMFTLVDFDGTEWQRTESIETDLSPAEGWLWPSSGIEPVPEDTEQITIQIGDLDQDRLPIPVNPRNVSVDGNWVYDVGRDEVIGVGRTTGDIRYVVTIAPRDLTADTLREDRPADAVAPSSALLTVPESAFVSDIRTTAQQIVAGAPSAYDQALALQSYFRNVENFRYDTQVPDPATDDAVWDFLTQRQGYCVQFATAMTIMARTVGIPARLAIGFLPGRPSTEVQGQYVVSGRQAHAWPELYFDDAGWVRFEPTPAAQTGAPPLYADPFAGQFQGPGGAPTAPGQQTATPGASRGAAEAAGPSGQVSIGSASIPLALVLGVAVLIAAALVGVLLVWRARRRRARVVVPDGPDAWWTELRTRLLIHGVSWSDATTPRQAADVIRERQRERHDAQEAGAALDALVAAVEKERYGPAPGTWPAEQLRDWVQAIERPWVPVDDEPDRLVGASRRS